MGGFRARSIAFDLRLRNNLPLLQTVKINRRFELPTFIASYDLKETNPDPHSTFLKKGRRKRLAALDPLL
jgi:hypothetical protein